MNLEELVLPLRADSAGFNNTLKVVTAGIGAVVAVAGLAIKATFDWANDLDKIGDVMDGTNDQFAALAFVARKSGVDVDTVAKANVLLEKGLLKSNGQLDTSGKKLKEYGISVKDVNGKVKDSVQLTDEIAKKYGELGTQQEKVNFLTEIYGKNGAALVDFFDTLAQEGGIDKVTEKVKAYGLAIDPARYEQFNRNLEELKMIGLGLAVGFTEKIMPALEGFMGWFASFAKAPSLGKLLGSLDSFVANIFAGIHNAINNWISSGGPEKLSNAIMDWVKNLGNGKGIQSNALKVGKDLLLILIKAFAAIDWSGIWAAISAKISQAMDALGKMISDLLAKALNFVQNIDWAKVGNDFIAGVSSIDWHGIATRIGDFVMNALTVVGNFLSQVGTILWTFLKGAIDGVDWGGVFSAIGTAIMGFTEGLLGVAKGSIASWVSTTASVISQWVEHTAALFTGWVARVKSTFWGWVTGTISSIVGWAASVVTTVTTAITTLETTINNKLREIAKTFFTRALAWTQQMIAGFKSGLGGLLGAISTLVGEINAILRKIITTFTISIKLPSWLGGASASAAPSQNPMKVPKGSHASGGSFMVPSSYGYEGFNMGNRDTASGGELINVTARGQANVVELSDSSINKLAERLGLVIPTATIKAMNNV